MEPGRHLVADHGAIRAHVTRLSARRPAGDERQHWLYLSCGKFNGLYEMDELQYRLVFPAHPERENREGEHGEHPDIRAAGEGGGAGRGRYVPAVLAGPTCDSDDAFTPEHGLVQVPETAASGDPVWILSCGAYAISYMTEGFNGFAPLPYTCLPGERRGPE